jgi:hypothetical protein
VICEIINGDCLEIMKSMNDNSVDLVFCSPPYEAARTYGIDFRLKGEAWVQWAIERYVECVRVSRGLVAWVVEGQTRQFRYTATPALLMADLHRRGIRLRKPPIFKRVGIPGSGGPDWLRNDYEFIVCASKGKLPWSDNTATGKPCRYGPGGKPSHRKTNGSRVGKMEEGASEPKAKRFLAGEMPPGSKLHTKNNGKTMRVQCYVPPELANPGNVIECVVGGGRMGSMLAHENEAPFPESLAEAFIKSFCPVGGTVLDCFCGSGTTLAVAEKNKRNSIGIDVRECQIELTRKRIEEAVQLVG